jgi:plasmid stabilization system protein ParE
MPRIIKHPEAENDLDEIWLYIAQDSPDQRINFLMKSRKLDKSLHVYRDGRNRVTSTPACKFPYW